MRFEGCRQREVETNSIIGTSTALIFHKPSVSLWEALLGDCTAIEIIQQLLRKAILPCFYLNVKQTK